MLVAVITAFTTVFIAEFGDKTQLVSMAMASRYPPLKVLGGTMTAMALLIGFTVFVGGFLAVALPHTMIAIISGSLFILFGLFNFFSRDQKKEAKSDQGGYLQTILLILLAELGDKTQLAVLFLAATLGYPFFVFVGAMLAMLCNHLIAVYLGSRVVAKLNPKYIKIGTSSLFIMIGLLILIAKLELY